MKNPTILMFLVMFYALIGTYSCNQYKTNPMSKQDSVNVEMAVRLDKIIRRIDSLEDRYNQDYAYNLAIQDTLYMLSTKKEANISGWRKAGRKIRELVEGYKEVKSVVPFL